MKGNGNIPASDGDEKAERYEEIRPGDVVRIRADLMDEVDMKPKDLFVNEGWPNSFPVIAVFNRKKDGVRCLSLDPCCRFLKDHSTGKYLCGGHPEKYFELDPKTEIYRNLNDRHVFLGIAGLEIASFDYRDEEGAVSLNIPGIFGSPVTIRADKIRELMRGLQEKGFI